MALEVGARRLGVIVTKIALLDDYQNVALEMADIHFADLDWRAGHPRLAAWFESFRQRPSLQASPLPDPREKPAG